MLFKKLIAITIAYSFLLQLGSQFGVWVNYMANTDYAIAHCENKVSKVMHCYGSCVLLKDLNSLEKHQSKENKLQLKVNEFQLFGPSTFIIHYFKCQTMVNKVGHYLVQILGNCFLSIFHPPD